MISVCIPVFNFDVRTLVGDLAKEIQGLSYPCEIICIDDASDDYFKNINGNFCDKHGKYIQLYENVGRSQIRNMFIDYAENDYLLFLDCDSLIHKSDFIAKYINCIEAGHLVVCGGRVYPSQKPELHFMLRWNYGRKREIKTAAQRAKQPHKSFMTCNFLVHKEILKQIPFNNSITRYGHEDTLFGFMLQQYRIPIHHADNSILNGEIETNSEFMFKSETAISNLVYINTLLGENKDFISNVTLLKWYYRLKKTHLLLFFRLIKALCKKAYRKRLLSGRACMRTFDSYKLMLFDDRFVRAR